jgi:hypothetical protein
MDSCGTPCPADIHWDFINYPITRENKKKTTVCQQGIFSGRDFFALWLFAPALQFTFLLKPEIEVVIMCKILMKA